MSIPESEAPYNPAVHKKTTTPKSLCALSDQAGFSAPYPCPVKVDLQIKAAQSDVYFIPRELARFAEFLQVTIDREHNRTPTAFTRGVYFQARQGLNSPAGYWHYDIGNPSITYLVTDKDPAIYAPDFPLKLIPELRREFDKATSLQQMEARAFLLEATDFERLKKCRQNNVTTTRFRPYEVVAHDHLSVHKGVSSKGRTLVTTGYIDTDQPAQYQFHGLQNNMFPDIDKSQTAPAEEATERLVRYLRKFPAPVL